MMITRVSMISGKEHIMDLDVTPEQFDEWQQGKLIQYAMPNLTPSEREFIMTGITPDEWKEDIASDD